MLLLLEYFNMTSVLIFGCPWLKSVDDAFRRMTDSQTVWIHLKEKQKEA